MITPSLCNYCEGPLSTLRQSDKFRLVSSDCRPLEQEASIQLCLDCGLVQRLRTEEWTRKCQWIYESYCAYPQGSRTDQKVNINSGKVLQSRSLELLEIIKSRYETEDKHVWLDIGCGQAHLLRLCSQHLPNLSFVGMDHSEASRPFVEAVDRAAFTLDLGEVDVCPGIISMLHVLEHTENPAHFLFELRRLMNQTTRLLIQVPTFTRNPMDLLIYDHGTFFTEESLSRVVSRAGLEVESLEFVAGNKELLVIAKKTDREGAIERLSKRNLADLSREARLSIEYLRRIRSGATILLNEGPVQVFGSSIGATWIYNELGAQNVDCFLDQDCDRIGNMFLGKEIRSTEDVDLDRTVFPLDPETRKRILREYGQVDR